MLVSMRLENHCKMFVPYQRNIALYMLLWASIESHPDQSDITALRLVRILLSVLLSEITYDLKGKLSLALGSCLLIRKRLVMMICLMG